MIGAIENAIVARIMQANNAGAMGYKLTKIDSYSGQFEADEFKQVVANFPCALVAYIGDWQQPERRQGGHQVFPKFAILVGAQNRRNQAAGRIGSDDKVGTSQIAADMRQLLAEQMLGLEIDPIQIGATTPLINSTTRDTYVSVLSLEIATGFFEPLHKPVGEDGDFTTFFAQWDIPPFADPPDPPAPLPRPADKVDSQQTVNLPQD